ncbi:MULTISPECIES: hypothetical protein [Photorhabdus]|uniref:Helix-turn-helix transcriptional regulator n=1 Tax=Photorhabdus aegyptia TaxID=2805098 RepID=A0A022PCM7_9GAMM|nr:hypothetical protein BA1DRAFT_03607 [Photorhabdus aegyptia]
MDYSRELNISPQVINTMRQSNEPWGIKDKNSCWIFGNQACKDFQNFHSSFDYEGRYDNELPWDGAEFAKEYVIHDQSVIRNKLRVCSLETYIFWKEQNL